MNKRKLLIVVGAGASVEFGMPSVACVGCILRAEAQTLYPLADDPSTNLYAHIEEKIIQYQDSRRSLKLLLHMGTDATTQRFKRSIVNFEDVLYTIFALAAVYPGDAQTSALGALVTVNDLHDFIYLGTERRFGQNILRSLGLTSVDSLLNAFRKQCRCVEYTKTQECSRLKAFMAELHKEFEIAVVSLNYDNIVYRSLPPGTEVGFDPYTHRFEQERIFGRQTWPCMLHLHGSVHFDMPHNTGRDGKGSANFHEIHWEPDINAKFTSNAQGRNTYDNHEGVVFPTSVIVAGYGKTTQLLRRPFRTYYSELDRLVANCDAVLFAGYGFGDKHLNLAFEGFRDSRRRPVAIIGHAMNNAMSVRGFRWDNAFIAEILRTFQTCPQSVRWRGHSVPSSVEEQIQAKEFECSTDPDTPLAFWYNGMLAACDEPDKVLARLR